MKFKKLLIIFKELLIICVAILLFALLTIPALIFGNLNSKYKDEMMNQENVIDCYNVCNNGSILIRYTKENCIRKCVEYTQFKELKEKYNIK